jgi:RNase P protein component
MKVAGRYRCARRTDHAVPERPPRSLAEPASRLDIRIWRHATAEQPLLLATTPRRTGSAVERNRFRRRARMACLAVLADARPRGDGNPLIWIRPAKGARVSEIAYADIEGQLRLAFSRFQA